MPETINLSAGKLSLEQLDLMLTHMPVELSFVDADGYVRYYSENPERIFKRTPAVIGKHVETCHPKESVHKVKQIIDAFKAGDKDTAEFWITLNGRFLLIRYFAVRNESGGFVGTLEVTQDVTGIRGLEGERRLLHWE